MNNIKIRKAVVADAENIVDITIKTWETTYGNIFKKEVFDTKRARRANSLNWWTGHLSTDHDTYVAVVDNEVVGFMNYYKDSRTHEGYAEISAIYILKEYQKLGIGRKFFEIAFDLTKKCGKNKLMLNVLDDNSATEFYKKMGGKKIGSFGIEMGGDKFQEDVMSFKV